MKDDDIIVRAARIAKKLADANNKGTIAEWLIYGAALAKLRSENPGTTEYGKMIVTRGLDIITGTDRYYALRLFNNWNDIEPHTREGEYLAHCQTPGGLLAMYDRSNRRAKRFENAIRVPVYESVTVNGVPISDISPVVESLAKACIFSDNDETIKILLSAVDKLSNCIINATQKDF